MNQENNTFIQRPPIMRVAAEMGLLMGLYWCLKYLLMIFMGHDFVMMPILYALLCLPVPVIAYYMTKRYRQRYAVERSFSFSEAFLFGVLLYLFAGIIVSPLHYYFYAYVLPVIFGPLSDYLLSIANPSMIEDMRTLLDLSSQQLSDMAPINSTINSLFNNFLWGGILTLPVALILRRSHKSVPPTLPNDE